MLAIFTLVKGRSIAASLRACGLHSDGISKGTWSCNWNTNGTGRLLLYKTKRHKTPGRKVAVKPGDLLIYDTTESKFYKDLCWLPEAKQ